MTTIKTKQPRKQRKRYFKAPYHLRNRMMTAPLSDALREKYGVRRLPIHKDDKVTVFKNKSGDEEIKGKIIRVLPQQYAIHIEGHSKEKADGTIVSFPVHPSNVVITSLHLRDTKRREMIQRRTRKELTEEELTEGIYDEEEELEETLEDLDLPEEEDLFEEFEELEADEPVVEEPVVEEPVVEEPAVKKPTAKKPTAKKPTAKKPTAKKPTAKKPTAKKPTAKKPTADKEEVSS
ncbi:MAG: 50S ribosomal protein L24 [Candidatus Heimdallarchaeaceae archaeon]